MTIEQLQTYKNTYDCFDGISSDKFENICDELIGYKKLEEQLGCPLEVREQALINGIYIENIYGEMVNFKVMLIYKNKELGYYFRFINDGYVLLTDYKKTWWLNEDKSE